ncbi:MAG: hypothetical protein FWD34_04780 [Oscillospiraceae bacterium]|nr:hypothetical protein [Oscillospiraceae bacterium]
MKGKKKIIKRAVSLFAAICFALALSVILPVSAGTQNGNYSGTYYLFGTIGHKSSIYVTNSECTVNNFYVHSGASVVPAYGSTSTGYMMGYKNFNVSYTTMYQTDGQGNYTGHTFPAYIATSDVNITFNFWGQPVNVSAKYEPGNGSIYNYIKNI